MCCLRTDTHESILIYRSWFLSQSCEMAHPRSAELVAVVTRLQKSCLRGFFYELQDHVAIRNG